MFDSRYAHVALTEHRAALCVHHVLSYAFDNGHTFKVNALDFITVILWSRVERHRQTQPCVQALPAK